MRSKLQRYYGLHDLHFITFSCFQRKPLLNSVRAKTLFVKILGEVRRQYQFALLGYVLMPEHVHLLIGEPVQLTPSKVVQILKQRVSRATRERKRRSLPPQAERPFFKQQNEPTPFWQRRFYDFNVYTHGKVKEKLNYMHANPVMRKLVMHPRDWPWSSWSSYECGEPGLISIDTEVGREFNSNSESGPP